MSEQIRGEDPSLHILSPGLPRCSQQVGCLDRQAHRLFAPLKSKLARYSRMHFHG